MHRCCDVGPATQPLQSRSSVPLLAVKRATLSNGQCLSQVLEVRVQGQGSLARRAAVLAIHVRANGLECLLLAWKAPGLR